MSRTRGMSFCRRNHVFGAIVDNFHGLSGFPREQSGVARDHRRIFLFTAKTSAGFGLDHANFVLRQPEKRQQSFVNIIGALHRAPDGHAVFGIRDRDHAVVFDVELLLCAGQIFAFDDMIRFFPYRIDIALFDPVFFENIASPQITSLQSSDLQW